MCRPSCCKPRSQAPGVAAVALIIGAGLAAGKLRPEAQRIMHDVIDVLRIIGLTITVIAAVTIVAWAAARLVRCWLDCRKAQGGRVHPVANQPMSVRTEQSCPACGGNREVLRANSGGNFEARPCPECQPARLAG
jgi:hypothetical protein